jgi:hypothetical protein
MDNDKIIKAAALVDQIDSDDSKLVEALPSVGNTRLPKAYANAKIALQACVNLDECQTWANKAEAMASYAKQANDTEMRKMADRIQARAIKRCGALLQEIDPSKGGRPPSTETREGTFRRPAQLGEGALPQPTSTQRKPGRGAIQSTKISPASLLQAPIIRS